MKSTHQATRVCFTPVDLPVNLKESRCPSVEFGQSDRAEFPWVESGWFSTIAQQSPDLVGAVSLEGNWLCLNPSGKATLGFTDALLPFTAFLSEPMQQLWFEAVLPQLTERGHWRGQFAMVRQPESESSEPIWFESQWFLVRDHYTNQPLGFATMSRAIHSCEATEIPVLEALEQALEKEKDCHQQKTYFLADAAHELKTPLAVMSTSIDLLTCDRLPIERKQKHVQRLRSKIRQMTQVLDDILILSRSEQAESGLHPTEIDLVQFCGELVEEAQMNTDRHEIVFSAESSVASTWIDTSLLQRIFVNLLSNSIKYSPRGGKICCRVSIKDDQVTLQVQDSGIGIPVSEQSQLFRSFYRASNAGQIAGTGLGLAIVKKCVDRLGGQITVSSTVQVGTCFVVTIPV